MRAKDLIVEDTHAVKLKTKNLDYYLRQKCPLAYQKAKEGKLIFRGRESEQPVSKFFPHRVRQSPYAANNFYNLLLSNLPNWSSYPRRDRSIICTTNLIKTEDYGEAYVVFPLNNPNIGICTGSDLWASFPYLWEKADIANVNRLNVGLQLLLESIGTVLSSIPNVEELETDYNKLLSVFQHIKESWNDDLINYLESNMSMSGMDVFNALKMYNGDMLEALTDLLDPSKNDFKCVSLSDFNVKSDSREVWFESPALLFHLKTFREHFADLGIRC